jgi:hypothetical protein
MYGSPRHDHPIVYRPVLRDSSHDGDARFPRAVAGEAYDRYARAAWRPANRWLARHAPRIIRYELSADEAGEMLRDVAEIDVARRLYPQEMRLIGELLDEFTVAPPAPSLDFAAPRRPDE